MALLPTTRRIQAENLVDAPDWFVQQVLYTINEVIENQYTAYDQNLSFSTNLDAQFKELTITTTSDYVANKTFTPIRFSSSLNGRVQAVWIAQILKSGDFESPITEPVTLDWLERDNQIIIRYISGLADNTKYFIRFLAVR